MTIPLVVIVIPSVAIVIHSLSHLRFIIIQFANQSWGFFLLLYKIGHLYV